MNRKIENIYSLFKDLRQNMYVLLKQADQINELLGLDDQVYNLIPKTSGPSPTIFQAYEKFLQENSARSHNYVRKFKSTIDYFVQACGDIEVKKIEKSHINTFLEHLYKHKINDNTANSHLGKIKSIIEVYEKNTSYIDRISTFETEGEYLTESELKLLESYQPKTKKLENIKDIFLFGCYTGLRYNELYKLSRATITNIEEADGNKIPAIKLLRQKGRHKKIVFTPLSDQALAIMAKYMHLPTVLPNYLNQKFNIYIKELGLAAGIIEKVQSIYYVKGERIEKISPKWKELTCHSARHTYTSLLLEKGVNVVAVRDSVGHASIATTNKYAHSDKKKGMKDILNALK